MKTISSAALAALLITGPVLAFRDGPAVIGEGGDSDFIYEIPTRASAHHGLAEQLDFERENEETELRNRIAKIRELAPEAPHLADNMFYHKVWSIRGETGRLMSLAADIERYDGGAHGISGYDSRLWDLERDWAIPFASLFTDRYAAYGIVDQAFCAMIQPMQEERGIDTGGDDLWEGCPLLHEQAIVPQGEPGHPFTAIGIYVPPYVAGPYVAGTFEVKVEVTPELVALVKPEYRDSFAAPSAMGGVSGGQ